MQVYTKLQNEPVVDCEVACTFGTFDGVHLGHQFIFSELIECAKKQNLKKALLTFSNHPSTILTPTHPTCYLTKSAQKLAIFEELGFDIVFNIAFDEQVKNLSPLEFLEKIRTLMPVRLLVAGSDAQFGKDREGGKELLNKWDKAVSVIFFERFCLDGIPVSSSRIRKAIGERDLMSAAKWLGRPYTLLLEKKGETEFDGTGYVLPPKGIYEAKIENRVCEVEVKNSSILQIEEIGYTKATIEIQLIKFLREGP